MKTMVHPSSPMKMHIHEEFSIQLLGVSGNLKNPPPLPGAQVKHFAL